MKWIAIFSVLIGNSTPVPVVDADGPSTFETAAECRAHLDVALPRLNEIVVRYAAGVDTLLIGYCDQQGE